MGDKDITEKLLEDYNDVFADIVNTLLFDGKEVIKPDELENTKDKSQYKSDDDELHEQERDVSKYWKKGKIKIALYGLENQTTVDKDMPMRVISYDGSSYTKYIPSDKQIKYVDEFLKLMKALTGDKMFVETNTKGGVISMCDVIRGAKEEGRIEGLEEGRIEGRIESLYYDSQKSLEDIATIVKCPIEFVKNVLEKKD